MQLSKNSQRFGDFAKIGIRRVGILAERMQTPMLLVESQQQVIGYREQRTPQRREHGQLVLRPLDSCERRTQRLHFFAMVE